MDDPRASASAEHLQTAARELIRAARSFLDLVEDVVEDPDRLAGAVDSVAGLVRDGLGHLDRDVRAAPWSEPAWGPVAGQGTDHGADQGAGDGEVIDLDDLFVIDDEVEGEEPPDPDEPRNADDPPCADQPDDPRPTDRDAPPREGPAASAGRVRRIAVE